MADQGLTRQRALRAATRFGDPETRIRASERRQRLRSTVEGRERDRLAKFRRRHDGADPCYAVDRVVMKRQRAGGTIVNRTDGASRLVACNEVAGEHGLCSSHARRRSASPFVDGRELTALVRQWVDLWEKVHETPLSDEPDGLPRVDDPTLSAFEALVDRTTRRGNTPVPLRVFESILRGERERVEFYELADPIVCALGKTEVFRNGVLPIRNAPALGISITWSPAKEGQMTLEEVAA